MNPFNTYVKDGSAGAKMQKIMGDIKPEAAYFTAMSHGFIGGGILVVKVRRTPSKIPGLAEPFFLVFNATVEFHPAMTPEDLGRSGLGGTRQEVGVAGFAARFSPVVFILKEVGE